MVQFTTEKQNAERNVVAIATGILNRGPNLLRKLWGQGLIRIQEKNPVVGQGQSVHRPLALLGPASLVMKLHNFCAERAGNLDRVIGALGVDDIHFRNIAEGYETAWQV